MVDSVKSGAEAAGNEKRFVALTSVFAAIVLTGGKLVIGILTGSLGILSEAAHSALDFVAAAITYFAVRAADRPADAEHRYGHAKIENLSALVETLLLLITCVWIVKEAVSRLIFKNVEVEATGWAFGVVIASIVIDISRSRALSRVAKKHKSQALEADALHFSTDVWSSTVVLIGLGLVKYGELTGRSGTFQRADALAALGVAVIVVHVSLQLGKRTIDALLDRAPAGLDEVIEKTVRSTEGVRDCGGLRLRSVGSGTFVDLAISVDADTPLEKGHSIAETVKQRLCETVPNCDVVVHVEPVREAAESMPERIREIAASLGHHVHSIRIAEQHGRTRVELHAEMSSDEEIGRAHGQVDELESAIVCGIPEISSVTIHIEPRDVSYGAAEDVTPASEGIVRRVRDMAMEMPGVEDCHDVSVARAEDGLLVSMHCVVGAGLTVSQAHRTASDLEARVRKEIPEVARVTTHAEPQPPAE